MAEKKLLNMYPVLAFFAGAALKGLSLIFNSNIDTTTLGLVSIFSLAALMLLFSLIYPK